MRTDPRAACANAEERLLWALVHDAVAHPLMALTFYCAPAVRFHDWTSQRAWPRPSEKVVGRRAMIAITDDCGRVTAHEIEPVGFYEIRHGLRSLIVRVKAADLEDAMWKGLTQFRLQDEHEAAR